jgi:LPXTG-site transpeptidase (sortase) family protein
MTVRTDDHRRVGTATRRLTILGAAWAAASVIGVAGCAPSAVTTAPSAVGSDSPTSTPSAVISASTSGGPATTAPPGARLTPVRIRVPAIDVDAPLVRLGLTSAGALAVPAKAMTAGWYSGSPVPGRVGPAVIAGHVHWSGIPAVFAHLAELTTGDRIIVTRSDASTATFTVDRVATYPKTRFPTALVYGSLDVAGLRLITCGGFDPVARTYEANVIVFATLVTT